MDSHPATRSALAGQFDAAKANVERLLAVAPPAVTDRRSRHSRVARACWPAAKRTIDVLSAATLLVLLVPLFICVAIAIKLDSRGPIFYRVRRIGYRGRPFMMLKFRKMHRDARGGPLTTGGDPRLTRVGAILTRTRLDEFPQLWDVLRGRMSLIGPRPEDPSFVQLHRQHYERILSVRPGMTGLSQLAYAEESRILDDEMPVADYVKRILPQKLTLDTLYARRNRLWLDLAILRWTIVTVLFGRPVAVSRSTGQMNVRQRPRPTSAPAIERRAAGRDGAVPPPALVLESAVARPLSNELARESSG